MNTTESTERGRKQQSRPRDGTQFDELEEPSERRDSRKWSSRWSSLPFHGRQSRR